MERLKRAMQSEEEADRDIKNLFECFSCMLVKCSVNLLL